MTDNQQNPTPAANQNQQLTDQVDSLLNCLKLNNETLLEMKRLMKEEFNLGLKDEESAVIKMLITHVKFVPSGDEKGKFLALDLGGTNFRTLLITLEGEGKASIKQDTHKIPKELMVEDGEKLFDHIASSLLTFVSTLELRPGRYPLGFTFSFPCTQYGLSVARLTRWTKGFNSPGVVGENVSKLLRDAIRRKTQDQNNSNKPILIDVVAVINDTTGTLMSCALTNKNCTAGLIVGTGCNSCYMEKIEAIEKWPQNYDRKEKQVIINTEWGAFGEGGKIDFMLTEWDKKLDEESINPGKQLYEKMVGGMYLGELVRHVMKGLCSEGVLFDGKFPKELEPKNSFLTKHLSNAESDEDNSQLKQILQEELKIKCSRTDIGIVRKVCRRISTRAAHLTAFGCALLIERINRKKCVIAYDGSVIKMHPTFLKLLKSKLSHLTNQEFELMESSDGSGRGAAVVAAVAHKQTRSMIIVRGSARRSSPARKRVYELSTYSSGG